MASIQKRGNTYYVVYRAPDENGNISQKWDPCHSKQEAEIRKKEVEYELAIGQFEVAKCTTVRELMDEYVKIYGQNK